MDDFKPIHFLDEPIDVIFKTAPTLQKSPHCPDSFIWNEKNYHITEKLSEWNDFTRRGTLRVARNMQPAHAAVASTRGSLNVGRFYFRVRATLFGSSTAEKTKSDSTTVGQTTQIFDIYYDRAMKSVDDRKGQWVLYRELVQAQ